MSGYYESVGRVILKNRGGFVVELDFEYYDTLTQKDTYVEGSGKNIVLGESEGADPGEYKVPDGAKFRVCADVKLGKSNNSTIYHYYKKGSERIAEYVISGTTLDNELGFVGYR